VEFSLPAVPRASDFEVGMEHALSALEFSLLNDYQRDFPLVSHPFLALADQLGVDEETVIDVLKSMQQRGLISRLGAVFRPNVVGVSALAALAVPMDRLEQVAAFVSTFSAVNHNYQREHCFNLWFVATASCADDLQTVFTQIEAACKCGTVLVLPLLEQFHIDLGFGLAHTSSPYFEHGLQARSDVTPINLTQEERAFMTALQGGLPWVSQPFSTLGWTEEAAIGLLSRWLDAGVIKRLGVVVRHQELGYTANAMVVWDVPDGAVSALGKTIAASGRVSLCYRRSRQLPHWSYNLFCMIHGKDRADVEQRIAALEQGCAMASYRREVLFSNRRFKQCGARYVADVQRHAVAELVHG
jgi:DNA-binding Lrp family transcriptional regulator